MKCSAVQQSHLRERKMYNIKKHYYNINALGGSLSHFGGSLSLGHLSLGHSLRASCYSNKPRKLLRHVSQDPISCDQFLNPKQRNYIGKNTSSSTNTPALASAQSDFLLTLQLLAFSFKSLLYSS